MGNSLSGGPRAKGRCIINEKEEFNKLSNPVCVIVYSLLTLYVVTIKKCCYMSIFDPQSLIYILHKHFSLQDLFPLLPQGCHSDWIFDIKWLDDEFLVTGKNLQ